MTCDPPRPPIGVRGVLACFSFAMFFGLAAVLSLVTLATGARRRSRGERRRSTARLNRGFRLFLGFLEDVRLIDVGPIGAPPGLSDQPYLLVSNHPTLLDAPILLAALPRLVSLVKASWYRSFALGPLLRRCVHVPGPGMPGDDDGGTPVVDRLEDALRRGAPVLAFPEGTRSPPGGLRRFRRGALEAALRAEVPIVPLFIGVDPPVLTKGQAPWRFASRTAQYRFEWLPPVPDDVRAAGSRAVARYLAERLGARLEAHRVTVARREAPRATPLEVEPT